MMRKAIFVLLAVFGFSWAMALVDINKASASELQTLKGIGAKKAADIIAYREQYGGFRTVDDLVQVRGIGVKTVERLRPEITVGQPFQQKKQVHRSANGRRIAVPATDVYRR